MKELQKFDYFVIGMITGGFFSVVMLIIFGG